jgi:phytoene synthase
VSFDPQAVERRVSGSSFYAGMRVLPRPRRLAMYAIYGFCREVDDIADDQVGSRAERGAALDAWRQDLARLYAGAEAQRGGYLAEPIRDFGLRQEDFLAVIDGMQMDVDQDIRAPDLAILDLYCDRVASAVGRLSIKVFGMAENPGFELAHNLGRALQLTNILRDLDEDAGIGRLYLPREHLEAAGIAAADPTAAVADPRVDAAARRLAEMAHGYYRESDRILGRRPAGRLAAPRLMSAVYAEILGKTEAAGWAPPRTRQSIGRATLLWIVLRRGLFG